MTCHAASVHRTVLEQIFRHPSHRLAHHNKTMMSSRPPREKKSSSRYTGDYWDTSGEEPLESQRTRKDKRKKAAAATEHDACDQVGCDCHTRVESKQRPPQAGKRADARNSGSEKKKMMRKEEEKEEEEENSSDDEGGDEDPPTLILSETPTLLMDTEFERWRDGVIHLLEIMLSVFLLNKKKEQQGDKLDVRLQLNPHLLKWKPPPRKDEAKLPVTCDPRTNFYSLVKSTVPVSSRGTAIHGLTKSFLNRWGQEPELVRKTVCELIERAFVETQSKQLLLIVYGGGSDTRILLDIMKASEHWGKWKDRVFVYDLLGFVRKQRNLWKYSDLDTLIDSEQEDEWARFAVSLSLRVLMETLGLTDDASFDSSGYHTAFEDVLCLEKLMRKLMASCGASLASDIEKSAVSLSVCDIRISAKRLKREETLREESKEQDNSSVPTRGDLQFLQTGLRTLGFLVDPLNIPEVSVSEQQKWMVENGLRKPRQHLGCFGQSVQLQSQEPSTQALSILSNAAREGTSLQHQAEAWWSWISFIKWRVTIIFFAAVKSSFDADERLHVDSLVAIATAKHVLDVWVVFKHFDGSCVLKPRKLGSIRHCARIDDHWFECPKEKKALVFEIIDWQIQDPTVQTVGIVESKLVDEKYDDHRVEIEDLGESQLDNARKFAKSMDACVRAESKGSKIAVCALLLDDKFRSNVTLPRLYISGDTTSRCCLCDSSSRRRRRQRTTREARSGIEVVSAYLCKNQWDHLSVLFVSSLPCSACRQSITRQGRKLVVCSSVVGNVDHVYMISRPSNLSPDIKSLSGATAAAPESATSAMTQTGASSSSATPVYTIELQGKLHAIDSRYFRAAEGSVHSKQKVTAFAMALLAAGNRHIPSQLTLSQHSALLGLLIQCVPRSPQRPSPSEHDGDRGRRICLHFQHGDRLASDCGLDEIVSRHYPRSVTRNEKALQPLDLPLEKVPVGFQLVKRKSSQHVRKHGVFSLVLEERGSWHLRHSSKFLTLLPFEEYHTPLTYNNKFQLLTNLEEEKLGAGTSRKRKLESGDSVESQEGDKACEAAVMASDKMQRIRELCDQFPGKGRLQDLADAIAKRKNSKKQQKKKKRIKEKVSFVAANC